MEQLHRNTIGYTIIILDKYILCGVANNVNWKPIEKLGRANIRHYKSLKVLLANFHYHVDAVGSHHFKTQLDKELKDAGFVYERYGDVFPDYSIKESLNYLADIGIIRIVRLQEVIDVEEEVRF